MKRAVADLEDPGIVVIQVWCTAATGPGELMPSSDARSPERSVLYPSIKCHSKHQIPKDGSQSQRGLIDKFMQPTPRPLQLLIKQEVIQNAADFAHQRSSHVGRVFLSHTRSLDSVGLDA